MFHKIQRVAPEARENDAAVCSRSREADPEWGLMCMAGGAPCAPGSLDAALHREGFKDNDDWHDDLVARTIAERIFASVSDGRDDQEAEDALAMQVERDFARKAFNDAESEAKLVEALNDRCAGAAFVKRSDLAVAASLQRLAQTAWIHYHHARAASERAMGDAAFSALAAGAVIRAHRAALAIRRASGRAATRAALRARAAARDRLRVPARLTRVRRMVGLRSRPRTPSVRRVRVSATASAGSGSGEPDPEPSPPRGTRLAAGNAHHRRGDAYAHALLGGTS